eukprot:145369-Rhodomonas_salina.4
MRGNGVVLFANLASADLPLGLLVQDRDVEGQDCVDDNEGVGEYFQAHDGRVGDVGSRRVRHSDRKHHKEVPGDTLDHSIPALQKARVRVEDR